MDLPPHHHLCCGDVVLLSFLSLDDCTHTVRLLCYGAVSCAYCVMGLQEVADHQRQLDALPGERECRQEEEQLTAEIQGLEKACQYRDVDMKATLEKQKKTDDEVTLSCTAHTAG